MRLQLGLARVKSLRGQVDHDERQTTTRRHDEWLSENHASLWSWCLNLAILHSAFTDPSHSHPLEVQDGSCPLSLP